MLNCLVYFVGKVTCEACKKKCKKEAVRLNDKFYHVSCFACKGISLMFIVLQYLWWQCSCLQWLDCVGLRNRDDIRPVESTSTTMFLAHDDSMLTLSHRKDISAFLKLEGNVQSQCFDLFWHCAVLSQEHCHSSVGWQQ